jgi:hypothetical protein
MAPNLDIRHGCLLHYYCLLPAAQMMLYPGKICLSRTSLTLTLGTFSISSVEEPEKMLEALAKFRLGHVSCICIAHPVCCLMLLGL